MRFLLLSLLMAVPPLAWSASPEKIVLPQDEFILPPLLMGFEGDHVLNITSLSGKTIGAKSGEWLEYGDSLDLPSRLSVWIIARENIQWTAGGVFQGKIGGDEVKVKTGTPYEITIDRGWMKVWIKGRTPHDSVKINTGAGVITSEQAIFWIHGREQVTELYLVEGMARDAAGDLLKGKMLYTWDRQNPKPKWTSKDWDESPWTVQLSGLYPSMVKISDRAAQAWKDGETEAKYADLRIKGWKKAARLAPPADENYQPKPKGTPHPKPEK